MNCPVAWPAGGRWLDANRCRRAYCDDRYAASSCLDAISRRLQPPLQDSDGQTATVED